MNVMENQLLVIFGASGDLTRRKLIPALFNLFCRKLLPKNFAILGVSRTSYNTDDFRDHVKKGLDDLSDKKKDCSKVDSFINIINYLSIETSDSESYSTVKKMISSLSTKYSTGDNIVFYLSTPPELYEPITRHLSQQGLNKQDKGWKRVIIEKPFGYDLKSAQQLNLHLQEFFTENQIYRIDHYLGKETVQNIMVTRFSNGIFEPLWNRNYIHHIEITSAESLGVEKRGGYYEKSGALRDMVQNHLLQLMTIVAMEPPTRINSDSIRNETLKVLQSIRPINKSEVENYAVRGQYTSAAVRSKKLLSYRDEAGVSKSSRTETFVALKLFVDNWRWGDVPFYIRTGKRLPTSVTEIVVHFNPTPHKLFCFDKDRFNFENQLVMRIQPDEGMLLKFGLKVPGPGFNVQDVNMDFHYSDLTNTELPEAYERLLIDCMQGDSTLFTRGDSIEQAWDIIDPVLDAWNTSMDIPLYGYPAGTWGPKEADRLIDEPGMTWRYPCKNLSNDGVYCEL